MGLVAVSLLILYHMLDYYGYHHYRYPSKHDEELGKERASFLFIYRYCRSSAEQKPPPFFSPFLLATQSWTGRSDGLQTSTADAKPRSQLGRRDNFVVIYLDLWSMYYSPRSSLPQITSAAASVQPRPQVSKRTSRPVSSPRPTPGSVAETRGLLLLAWPCS